MEADYPHTNADIGGEGEHNHHGEKKSVMRKVKDKAKKIKDTIKKHGGHDHEEEDDEDEETVNASEIHGAPLHESGFISGTNLPKQTGLDLEKPTDPPEDPNLTTEAYTIAGDGRGATKTTGVHDYDHSLRNEVYGSKNPGVREEVYDSNTRDEFRPEDRMTKIPDLQDEHEMDLKPTVKIGPLEDLEEDPNRPTEEIHPSNYQTKVVDPTGQGNTVDPTGQVGKEADVSPLAERLGNLHVNDESGPEQRPFTGSHDQFAPDSDDIPPSKNPESPKRIDPAQPESMPQDTFAGKISSATSAIADKAVSAKNAVATKLGYGEAGAAAVGGGGESDKGVSVKEYWSEKLSPGEEDRASSEAITGVIQKGYKPEDPGGENTGTGPGVVGRVKGWLGMGSGGSQSVDQDSQSGAGGDVPNPVGGLQ